MFTDEQLDQAAPFSLSFGAPVTAQFVIEDHALRHSWHHLAKIRAGAEAVSGDDSGWGSALEGCPGLYLMKVMGRHLGCTNAQCLNMIGF